METPKEFNNEIVDGYGFTDRDIVQIVESGDIGQWRNAERVYIIYRYNDLKPII